MNFSDENELDLDIGNETVRIDPKSITLLVKNVSKSFGSFMSGDKFLALRDINFYLEKGQNIAILGPNGSGKTTLFKILSSYHTSYRGKHLFFTI